MQTTYRLQVSELGASFIDAVKALFKKDEIIEVDVHSVTDFNLYKKETKKECRMRINKAIEDVEKGRNLVTFTEKEFDELTDNLLQINKR